MKYHLRQAIDSDKEFLYSLHCATMRDAIKKTWGWDEAWQRNDFERRFDECSISIIEVEGQNIGCLWLRSSPDLIYIGDFQVRLIRRYLQAGIMKDGLTSPRTEGTPQGSPLSPLLSNILLDELDKELEERGHRFCRYADDVTILVKSEASGKPLCR